MWRRQRSVGWAEDTCGDGGRGGGRGCKEPPYLRRCPVGVQIGLALSPLMPLLGVRRPPLLYSVVGGPLLLVPVVLIVRLLRWRRPLVLVLVLVLLVLVLLVLLVLLVVVRVAAPGPLPGSLRRAPALLHKAHPFALGGRQRPFVLGGRGRRGLGPAPRASLLRLLAGLHLLRVHLRVVEVLPLLQALLDLLLEVLPLGDEGGGVGVEGPGGVEALPGVAGKSADEGVRDGWCNGVPGMERGEGGGVPMGWV